MAGGINITQTITDKNEISLKAFFRDISKYKPLTTEEEFELSKKIQQGDKQALDKLILSNIKFIISVAKQYQYKGLPLPDLIQSGFIGMREAALKFRPEKECRFISYAVWWIRQAITQSLSFESRTVRTPVSQININNKVNKVIAEFEQEFGRTPSTSELELLTDYDASQIDTANLAVCKSISLDSPLKVDEDGGTLYDITADENSELPGEHIEDNYVINKISEYLHDLSDREADTIRMYFGIGMECLTLEAISNRFGVIEERIRQIKLSGLNRLKKLHRNELKELL